MGVSAMSSNSTSDLGGIANAGGAGAAGVAVTVGGAAAAAGRGADSADSTSRLTMRPPGPLPARARRSRPDWAAIFRASGDAFTRPPAGAAPDTGAGAIGTTLLVAGLD